MGENVRGAGAPAPVLDGRGQRVAVLAARFNDHVTLRLLDGAERGLAAAGVADGDVTVAWVPGAFELPLAAAAHARSGRFDAVVALGCVIRGDTAHFEYVAGECARGLQSVAVETGVPVAFGVLTTENLDQALERSEAAGGHNVGEEAAQVAVEMASLVRAVSKGPA